MGLNGRECGGGTSECVQWERVDVSTVVNRAILPLQLTFLPLLRFTTTVVLDPGPHNFCAAAPLAIEC